MRIAAFALAGPALLLAACTSPEERVADVAVSQLAALCDPYLDGTPFPDAAVAAGFELDPERGDYFLEARRDIIAGEPASPESCSIQIFFAEDFYPEIFAADEALALSRGMTKVLDGEHFVSPEEESVVTRWDNDTESVRVLTWEWRGVAENPDLVAPSGLQLSIER
jgi:hypothetical protein